MVASRRDCWVLAQHQFSPAELEGRAGKWAGQCFPRTAKCEHSESVAIPSAPSPHNTLALPLAHDTVDSEGHHMLAVARAPPRIRYRGARSS